MTRRYHSVFLTPKDSSQSSLRGRCPRGAAGPTDPVGGRHRTGARLLAVEVAAAGTIHAFRHVRVHSEIRAIFAAFRPGDGTATRARDTPSHRRWWNDARYAGVDAATGRRTAETLAAAVDVECPLEGGGG